MASWLEWVWSLFTRPARARYARGETAMLQPRGWDDVRAHIPGGGLPMPLVASADRERERSRWRAAALEAFGPSQPVENRFQLLGRDQELGQLRRAVLDLGSHALVYGARGAGKTSLARAFGDDADERGHVVLYQAASDGCDFATLFRPYLAELAVLLPSGNPVAKLLAQGDAAAALDPRTLCGVLADSATCPIILISTG